MSRLLSPRRIVECLCGELCIENRGITIILGGFLDGFDGGSFVGNICFSNGFLGIYGEVLGLGFFDVFDGLFDLRLLGSHFLKHCFNLVELRITFFLFLFDQVIDIDALLGSSPEHISQA